MKRFLALGDSYTIGEGVDPAERWPSRLAGLLRAEGLNVAEPEIVAKTGWTTAELDAAIDAARPAGAFDLVSLLVGVNDQYRGLDVVGFGERFEALLGRAIAFAASSPSRVVVVSIPDWGVTPFAREKGREMSVVRDEIDAFNAIVRAEAVRARTRFVDVTAISRLASHDRSMLAADGLHPSSSMYLLWAKLVLEQARAALGCG
ncbi:MAG: SGNH/GDSL hydrolase family protein [Thermoanaerobaculia bacterium]